MFKFLNPWFILGVLVAILAAGAGGIYVGKNWAEGQQAKEEVLIQKVYDASQLAAAGEISKIKIVNQTNRTRLEREIVKVPDFSNCHAGHDVQRVLDDALTNKAGAEPAGDLKLPGANPAG